jgi:hypothetical protein
MKRFVWLIASFCLAAAGAARAEDPIVLFEKLREPLKLPASRVLVLPLNKTASSFGDMLRAVDCAEDKDLPFGLCSNLLFGGLAITDTHLTGNITIRFQEPVRNVAHFEVYLGALSGDDSTLVAPMGYELPVIDPSVFDVPDKISEGDVDLTTGGVSRLKFYCYFSNSALVALKNVNPKLENPIIEFPGTRGHAYARFEPRSDGQMDFTFRGSAFLSLGKNTQGDPLRFPLPFCGPDQKCASVLARGTSLHPHLYLSTREPEGALCGANCPEIPTNSVVEFTVNTAVSSFGDDFNLDIKQLGGLGPGRSHVQGRLQIQFGARNGDTVPFAITSIPPAGLLAVPPPSILGAGFAPGLIGHDEFLRFPLLTYKLEKVAFVDEPFNFPQGAVNLKTGRVIGEMEYPSYYSQSLAEVLFSQNDGRISTDPFFLVASRPVLGEKETMYALFEKGSNGELIFRYSAEHRRSFASYRFPSPDFVKANSFISGDEGTLDLFLRLQAVSNTVRPAGRLQGGATNILSSINDRVSYSYSIPCDAAGASAAFEYTNANSGASGGTFKLAKLASVNCIASHGSRLPAGQFDSVAFTAFGTWSKDPSGADPRFAAVFVSTNPDTPYIGIQIFQNPDPNNNNIVILSSANTKPTEKPFP